MFDNHGNIKILFDNHGNIKIIFDNHGNIKILFDNHGCVVCSKLLLLCHLLQCTLRGWLLWFSHH